MSQRLILAPLALLLLLAGCGGEFPNQEMDLAGEQKLRPIAVTLDPPEAAPGQTVRVTLLYYSPDQEPAQVDWQVAMDYRLGLYEVDEVEQGILQIPDVDPPVYDAAGYAEQTFTMLVPDTVLLTTSAQPDTLDDELLLAVARPLLGKSDGEPVTRMELDAAFKTDGFVSAAPDTMKAYLADLFGCEIRFRARLRRGISVDVTRNLTVRYSGQYGSLNRNTNPWLQRLNLYAVPFPDVDADDLGRYETQLQVYPLAGDDVTPHLVSVLLHRDWTFILGLSMGLDAYTSPFEPESPRLEKYQAHWYHLDLVNPLDADPFYVTDEGDEAEMSDLDSRVRLAQPVGDGPYRYRVTAVVRDRRLEWMGTYTTTPGASVITGEFEFVEP
ncbi:hypothetical protein KDK88_02255 [bacterium]|nr:hypothetical protein [bacterium]